MTVPLLWPVLLAGAFFGALPPARPAALPNQFFALDTAMVKRLGKDSVERADVRTVAALGYAGVAVVVADAAQWRYLEEKLLPWLDEEKLKLYAVFIAVELNRDSRGLDAALEHNISRLKGRRSTVWLAIKSKDFQPSDAAADDLAVALIRQIADAAARCGSRVSLYPHVNQLMERTTDAVRLARKAGRSNVGVTLNLCHWLRRDGEASMGQVIDTVLPYLDLVTINGADRDGREWIQPLDSGTFDVAAFLRRLHEAGYRGPIGLQGYDVALRYSIDPPTNLSRSMAAWKKLSAQAVGSPQR